MQKTDWLIAVVPAFLAVAFVAWYNGDQLFPISADAGIAASVLPSVGPTPPAAPAPEPSSAAPREVVPPTPPQPQAAPPAREPSPTPPPPTRTIAPTPPGPESTPIERGRYLTKLFYAGQLPQLWQTFSPSLRASWVNLNEFERYRKAGAKRFGRETHVVSERVIKRASITYYNREARFESDPEGAWTVIIGVDPAGSVNEFNIVAADLSTKH